MQTTDLIPMPNDFAHRIRLALRSWHDQKSDDALMNLLLVQQAVMAKPSASPRFISNEILLKGIEHLRQTDKDGAEILVARFLDQETAQAVGFQRNLSEDIIFQRQRTALEQLAVVIWGDEQALLKERKSGIEARLEPPTYQTLFGVDQKIAQIRSLLEQEAEPGLLALEGMGGLGKTSLADALARQLAGEIHFEEIGWVSARRHLFQFSGDIALVNKRPDLTIAELIDALIEQFHLTGLLHTSETDKFSGVKDFLKSRRCLVIVDNLETVADYESLVSHLIGLANPSKFLITTRYSLQNLSGVYLMRLKQLERADALAFIRYEAKTRGLLELSEATESELEPIYAVTGGNPLATKLIMGQMHNLPLKGVLARFAAGQGKPVETLLDFMYSAIWDTLDAEHRRVLQAMLLVAGDGQLEQIAAVTELSEDKAASYLHTLVGLSLVNVSGSLHEKRYSLHQLAQAFITQQT